MKHILPGPLPDHARNIMRRLGYGEQVTKRGQVSFVRRVSGERFPRYHAYVEDMDKGMIVNLHIDQKEASYEGTHAHAGEYEGPLVTREMERIIASVSQMSRMPEASSSSAPQKKKPKGFWKTILGR